MTTEELQKLDDYKHELMGYAEQVSLAQSVIEKMKDCEYVEELLAKNYAELREKWQEIHEQMFPKS